jgi:cell division protein FtsZ
MRNWFKRQFLSQYKRRRQMIELLETTSPEAVIKVVGVGGCGGNAVDHMINNGVQGVEFITMNTGLPGPQAQPREDRRCSSGRASPRAWARAPIPEVGRLAAKRTATASWSC